MEKIYSRIVRIVSIIIIGYLFLQGLFTICNMQRVTEQVYYMKIIPGVSFCALESWYCCAWLPENVR